MDNTQLNAVAKDPVTEDTVDGTFVYNPLSGTELEVGNNQNLNVVFTPNDAVTYNSATKDVKINVLAAPVRPVASFTENETEGTAPLDVQFNDTSTNSPNEWLWQFGDETENSTEQNPVHRFTSAGIYTVNVTATNAAGSNVSTSKTITVNTPVLLLSKSALPTTYDAVGQNITYTYTVTNTGNVNILGPINVIDNKTGTIILSNSALAPGQNVTGTANYTITQADNGGSVTNVAFATGTFNGTLVNSTSVTATVTPAMLLTTSASQTTYTTVGQTITYTYNVTNTGIYYIRGPINVTDDKFGTVQTIPYLVPGQTSTGTFVYSITQSDLDNGSITNVAYSTGPYRGTITTSNTASATITAEESPILPILPLANFTVSKNEGFAPLTVQFNDTSTNNPNKWSWDFGDGNNSTERNPIHEFTAKGNYAVNLTVTNEDGTNSTSSTITVFENLFFPNCINPPTDPDHDGLYEDVNGNGILDFNDVITYFVNMDWIEQNAPVVLFDYNKNSIIDFDDVIKLYSML